MRIMKKGFLSILILMLMTITCAYAQNGEYFDICNNLGLLPKENYYSDKYVTRAELAFIAANITQTDVESLYKDGEIFFDDVGSDCEYVAYINGLARLGLIKGFSDDSFEPNYNVTKTDISYTFVNILGYKYWAEQRGGYPFGYISVADEIGLFDNVSIQQFVTQAQICKIPYRQEP